MQWQDATASCCCIALLMPRLSSLLATRALHFGIVEALPIPLEPSLHARLAGGLVAEAQRSRRAWQRNGRSRSLDRAAIQASEPSSSLLKCVAASQDRIGAVESADGDDRDTFVGDAPTDAGYARNIFVFLPNDASPMQSRLDKRSMSQKCSTPTLRRQVMLGEST